MRSYLFVPADSARKRDKALQSGADALILDLEDSVSPANKVEAREMVAAFLADRANTAASGAGPRIHIRVNSFDSGLLEDDLDCIGPGLPDGIVLPKSESGGDVQKLDALLRVAEARAGAADGAIPVMAIATETAAAMFTLGTYGAATPRLASLSWGAEDLSADIGAQTNRDGTGQMTEPFRLARSLCLFGAASAGVPAIDTVFVDFRDMEGLAAECRDAVRDGFAGKLAIHPAQLPVINDAFTPDAETVETARRIVQAFADQAGMGVTSLDGQMLDRPHLRRAERILQRARLAGLS